MIKALLLIIIVVIGLVLGTLWRGDTGTLIIIFGHYTVEMTLVVAVLLAVILALFVWLVSALLGKLFASKRITAGWLRQRKQRQAEAHFELAFTEWLNKNYSDAARLAEKAAPQLSRPQLGYLLAAAAQQALGKTSEQQRLLQRAEQQQHDALSVRLATLEHNQDATQALRLAQQLLEQHPRNPSVLRVAAAALYKHQHYQSLRALLPDLQSRDIIPGARLAEYTRASYRGFFQGAGSNSEQLHKAWLGLAKKLRRTTAVRLAYLDILSARGFGAVASKVAARGLRLEVLTASDLLRYDATIWREAGELRNAIEAQVKAHPQHPNWLLLLAEITLQEGDFALAERATQKAIRLKPDARAYRILGDALFASEQKDAALNAYRQAALLRQD